MNERIRELAARAYSYSSEQTREFTPEFMAYYDEKFSELIIRECAHIADRKYLYSKEPNRWDSGFNISCNILEQFGILKDE